VINMEKVFVVDIHKKQLNIDFYILFKSLDKRSIEKVYRYRMKGNRERQDY